MLDHQLPDDELAAIEKIAMLVESVKGVHQLRTRKSGATRFIQLHLELEDKLLLIEAHRIADQVEQDLLNQFPFSDVLIHQDPVSVVYKK